MLQRMTIIRKEPEEQKEPCRQSVLDTDGLVVGGENIFLPPGNARDDRVLQRS